MNEATGPERLRQRVRYLRDCYQADNRGGRVLDLLASKIEHLAFVPSPEELLTGSLNPASMERAAHRPMAAAAALYRREQRLLYCAFPLVGRGTAGEEDGEAPRLCAPLLTYPASLEAEPGFPESLLALSVELGEQRVNFGALVALLADEAAASRAADLVLECVGEPPFSAESVARLAELLESLVPGLDAAPLRRFPALAPEAEVRAEAGAAWRADGRLRCLSACAVALVPTPVETRGVLHELAAIADSSDPSRPLRLLLGAPVSRRSDAAPAAAGAVPAVLSNAQQRALASAAHHPLTLIAGPPGTGKSYTVAAIALDHVARGEPVLLASRSDQALAVLADKIEQLLGGRAVILRGGRGEHLRQLKDHLEQLLHGNLSDPGSASGPPEGLASNRASLRETERALLRQERALTRRAELEARWGEGEVADRSTRGGLWAGLVQRWRRFRLERSPAYPLLLERYEELLAERTRLVAERLRQAVRTRLEAALAEHRPELAGFLKALRARRSAEQEARFSAVDFDVLLRTFPLWMVSFADLHQVLPLAPGLFSLVIVDEATQCDTASCLPALFRARRAVVTGDPKQLRHVSFLARHRQQALGERHALSGEEVEAFDYRSRSLLDLAGEAVESQQQVVFLEEHFRSTPRLIAFSNREFYRGSLRVMTRRPEVEEAPSLFLRRVEGRRRSEGHNPEEAAALLEELERWVDSEAGLPARGCHSLGVLSPFREQVDHLAAEVQRRLGLASIERHRLLVGTPYAFQGDERDVMLLSLALDPGCPRGSFLYLDRADVFNVAITRARSAQLVFCSLAPEDAPAGSLLARYLAEAAQGSSPAEGGGLAARDAFLAEVREALAERGFRTWPAYVVAGLPVDLVIAKDGASLGLDLVGHPGAFAGALDLERYRMLQRAGLALFPLTLFAWRKDRAACLDAIAASLARRAPGYGESTA